MNTGAVFLLVTVIFFLVFQRRASSNLISVVGNLVLSGVVAFAIVAGYQYVDKRGYVPQSFVSEVRDVAQKIWDDAVAVTKSMRH